MAEKIAVIGTGYVGLVTGACLASLRNSVVCADPVTEKIEKLQRGELPIVEPELGDIVKSGLKAGNLRFTTDSQEAVKGASFVFLCVPTPSNSDGSVDLSYLQEATEEIKDSFESGVIIVNKSTVPVGSTRVVENIVERDHVFVVSNPEFLREGSAVHDFLHPDRIVIGGEQPDACQRLADLFSPISSEVIITDPASAETIKYGANAFLATKISFANALASLCEEIGANVADVLKGIGSDPRIGMVGMQPGPGWGGSCFPKDTRALLAMAQDVGYDFTLLRGVIEANNSQRERIVEKVKKAVNGTLLGRSVAVWGLTFKAGTDDLRESPAISIINQLRDRGANIKAYDPTNPKNIEGVEIHSDPYTACDKAEILVVLTEWPEFKEFELGKVKTLLKYPRIVDARNILDPKEARKLGFTYTGVGGV